MRRFRRLNRIYFHSTSGQRNDNLTVCTAFVEKMNDGLAFREFVMSLDRPAVFRGMINDWTVLSWPLERWSAVFGMKPLPFRSGVKRCSSSPFWESLCETRYLTMAEFIEKYSSEDFQETKEWQYFDYKYVRDWVEGEDSKYIDDIKNLSWANLGFPELGGHESTLWIGSEGAHTPCHIDTYGCNLVAQIHGHKQWILFPPGEGRNLEMSRIPYEESSIYSQLNFSCPLEGNVYSKLRNIYEVTLHPGDVLYVPHHWWHYVENLDLSVSINTWLSLPSDDVSRVDESLVRFFMAQICRELTQEEVGFILNPNEDLFGSDIFDNLNLVGMCLKKIKECCATSPAQNDEMETPKAKKPKQSSSTTTAVDEESAKLVPECTQHRLKSILDAKCTCASGEDHKKKTEKCHEQDSSVIDKSLCRRVIPEKIASLVKVINAFCNPDTISKVKEQLL